MRYTIFFIFMFLAAACGSGVDTLDTPPPAGAALLSVNYIKPAAALPKVQAAYSQFVDVRTPEEFAAGHATRAINIRLDELTAKLDRLERNEPVYVICQTGRRSKEASEILSRNGFKWVFSVEGGTEQWQAEGLPIEIPAQIK